MQTAEIKTSSTALNQIQKKQQPFFNKEGQDGFFSKPNETTQPFFNASAIQTKLTIGQPNDKYEVEADAMADKVVQRLSQPENNSISSTSSGTVQRQCSECEEEQLQKKEEPLAKEINSVQLKPIFESNAEHPEANVQTKPINNVVIQAKCSSCEQEEHLQKKEEEELSDNELSLQRKGMETPSNNTPNLESRLNSSKGGGNSLPSDLQTSMGSEFGADFSTVRIHTGTEAVQMSQDIGAQAFTHGSDIYFNEGKYDTNSNSGKHLLAHELTHTIQQGQTSTNIQKQDEDGDTGYESDEYEEGIDSEYMEIPYSCHELVSILSPIIKRNLTALLVNPQYNENSLIFFLDEVVDDIAEQHLDISEPTFNLIENNTYLISTIESSIYDLRFNYVSAVLWLQTYLGNPPEVLDAGGEVSYGLQFFINTVANEMASYIIRPLRDRLMLDEEYCPNYSLEDLQHYFDGYVSAWGTKDNLIELEFIGSMEALIQLRSEFINPENTREDNIRIGTEITRLSRYILLLDRELEELRDVLNSNDQELPTASSQSELEIFIESNIVDIERIRSESNSESESLLALGNETDLLKNRGVNQLPYSNYAYTGTDLIISPDSAFPVATDDATLTMMGTLAERIDTQITNLEGLQEEVIPSNPDYSINEFMRIYDQWFAFFSPTARDLDPYYREMDTFISEIYMIMGYAGVEGGIGRWLFMEQIINNINHLGSPNRSSFTNIIHSLDNQREERVSGDATNINYQVGEFFGGTATNFGPSGEADSRNTVIQRERFESTEGFNRIRELKQASAPVSEITQTAEDLGLVINGIRAPIILLPKERHQNLWSYLITTHIPNKSSNSYFPIHEQQVIPQSTSRFLLAQTQHYNTLNEVHKPGIGDGSTRVEGIESGRAASTSTYLQGGQSTAATRKATELRRSMSEARNNLYPNLWNPIGSGSINSVEELVVQNLLNDLNNYLDEYFVQNEDVESRVLAILRISIKEHRGDEMMFHHLTAWELGKALGISLGIAAMVSAIRLIPYIGYALSHVIGKILKRYGIATDVGSIISIAGFIKEAGNANGFYAARRWGYIGKFILSEFGKLVQGLAVSSPMIAFQYVRTIRSKPHSSVDEVMKDLDVIIRDPEMKQILRAELLTQKQSIEGQGSGNQSNSRLELINDILLRLDGSARNRPIIAEPIRGNGTEADSIIRADSTITVRGENHGMSVSYRDGRLVVRVCSDCDLFIRALNVAMEMPSIQRNTRAMERIRGLKNDATALQEKINNQEISLQNAQPKINAMMGRLKAIGREHPDVVDAIFNRDGARSFEDGLSSIRSLTELTGSSRGLSVESMRAVESESGNITLVHESAVPNNLRPGQSFEINGARYVYHGDPYQRMLIEEGFSSRDMTSIERMTRIKETHDMGVEQGRAQAISEGIRMTDFHSPDQHLGLYGKGIDDIGVKGNIFYVLEWKGGSSSLGNTRHGRQMSDEWIGTKLAEFNIYHSDAQGNFAMHPRVEQFLRAADAGRLRGRAYKTEWDSTRTTPEPTTRIQEGPLANGARVSNGEIRYDGAQVRAAFDVRINELKRIHGITDAVQPKLMNHLSIQQKCKNCEEDKHLQMKPMGHENVSTPNLESRLSSSKGKGHPLPLELQISMSSEFGANFSNVRIHTNSEAAQLSQDIGAQAFTHGSDIYFNKGKYDTNSNSGKHLLAHELTHTIQQGKSARNIQRSALSEFSQEFPQIAAELSRLSDAYRNLIRHVDPLFSENGIYDLTGRRMLNGIPVNYLLANNSQRTSRQQLFAFEHSMNQNNLFDINHVSQWRIKYLAALRHLRPLFTALINLRGEVGLRGQFFRDEQQRLLFESNQLRELFPDFRPNEEQNTEAEQLSRERESGDLRWFLQPDIPSPIIRTGTTLTLSLRNNNRLNPSRREELARDSASGEGALQFREGEIPVYTWEEAEFGIIDETGREFPWPSGTSGYPLEFEHTFNQQGRRIIYFRGRPNQFSRNTVYVRHVIFVGDGASAPYLDDAAEVSQGDLELITNPDTGYGELVTLFKRIVSRDALEMLSDNKREAIQLKRHYEGLMGNPSAATDYDLRTGFAFRLAPVHRNLVEQKNQTQEEMENIEVRVPTGDYASGRPITIVDHVATETRRQPLRQKLIRLREAITEIEMNYPEVAALRRFRNEASLSENIQASSASGGGFVGQMIRTISGVERDIDSTRHNIISGNIDIMQIQSITTDLRNRLIPQNPNLRTALNNYHESGDDLWLSLGITGVSIALLFVPGIGPFLSAAVGLIEGAHQAAESWEEAEIYRAGHNAGLREGVFSEEQYEERRRQVVIDSLLVLLNISDFGTELVTVGRFLDDFSEVGRAARRATNTSEELVEREVRTSREISNEVEEASSLRNPAGSARPTSSRQTRLLQDTSHIEDGRLLTPSELEAELDIVRRSEVQPSSRRNYIGEVDLGNGHIWRQNSDGTWCRFSGTPSLCGTTLTGSNGLTSAPSETWTSPLVGSSDYDDLLERRGSAEFHLEHRPSGWRARDEARFRYGPEAEPQSGYRWVLLQDGTLRYDRVRRLDDEGEEIARRYFDVERREFIDRPPRTSSVALESEEELASLAHIGSEAVSRLDWLSRLRTISGLENLSDEALERVMRFSPNINHMKGQLLEEIATASLTSRAEAAGEAFEFIAGHRIQDAVGNQLTDGILVRRGPDGNLIVLAIAESKAGQASSRGLRRSYTSFSGLSERELSELRGVAIEELRLRNGLNPNNAGIPEWALMENISQTHQAEIEAIMREIHTHDMGQIEKDFERLMPISGDGRTTSIRIDGELVEVEASRRTTRAIAIAPDDVSLTSTFSHLDNLEIQHEALETGISSSELIELSRILRAETIQNGSRF
ncbi:eCIS core domain-containing protein [Psychroserpens luteolus]|uniref:eCIS core domain-containing protein n=1 Tax=Psychroserpens luteolus TaxID=2855840 RepID=UPI001E2BF005|nr:DUF4157 domain-containing protein [Psychroserpens luteolus]MCD2257709.1 DUF4157 domain-containing protein [Psychroserpens luteolus]